MKFDIKTIDHWEAPDEDSAPLLTMPNIPLPLHGQPPRVIMGATAWNKMRKQCYENANYTCQITGVELGQGHCHCLPRGTEVLTSNGWKPIEAITVEDMVAQFTPETETVDFAHPTDTIHYKTDHLTQLGYKKGLKILSTDDHRTLVFNWTYGKKAGRKSIRTVKASEAPTGGDWNIWTAGYGAGDNSLTNDERVIIALQADGTLRYFAKDTQEYVFNIRVSKDRKKAQVLRLVSSTALPHQRCLEKTRPQYLGYNFRTKCNCKDFWDCFDLTEMSALKAQQFISELVKWDGWEGKRGDTTGRCWYTTNPHNLDFVQAVATLAGIGTHVTSSHRKEREWVDGRELKEMNYKRCWNIEFLKRNYRTMQTMTKERITYDDEVFCITVPSHYFVARQNGEVFITGNCHEVYDIDWANQTATFKRVVCVSPRTHTRFIHSGRALTMFERGDKNFPKSALIATVEESFRLIRDWNDAHPNEEPLRIGPTFLDWVKNPKLELTMERLIDTYNIKFYDFDMKCFDKKHWSNWKLVYNGEEYPTKFANQQEWEEAFKEKKEQK